MATETKQVKGLDVTLDPSILEDWDVMNDIMNLVNDDPDKELTVAESKEMLQAANRLIDTIYGKDFERIKKKLRTANGGKLPLSLVMEFINDTFVAFQQKNS